MMVNYVIFTTHKNKVRPYNVYGGGGTLPQKNKNKEQKITQKTTLCITERAIIISCIKPIKNKSKKTHMI